jgi:hypothetical protein
MASPNEFPARGKLLSTHENGSVIFAPTGTNYEVQLQSPEMVNTPVNTPVQVLIRAKARRLWTAPSGGNFIAPIFGPPRTIQGRVKHVSNKRILVHAGVPISIDLPAASTAMDMHSGGITVGSLVNVLAFPGATCSAWKLITVIGRGHSGTRAISQTLKESGTFMGDPLNESYDLIPPEDLYEACRVMAEHVRYKGNYEWDFSKLHRMPIPKRFTALVESFLKSLLNDAAPCRGWKLPETTLIFPWIVRMFPDAWYIYWIRDPRDSILGKHLTDDLADFGVPYEKTDNLRLRRAISWKYQSEIVKATPKPRRFKAVRFEDFVLNQTPTLQHLDTFLGMPLKKIDVNPDSVGRYKQDNEQHDFDFFLEEMIEHGYLKG